MLSRDGSSSENALPRDSVMQFFCPYVAKGISIKVGKYTILKINYAIPLQVGKDYTMVAENSPDSPMMEEPQAPLSPTVSHLLFSIN